MITIGITHTSALFVTTTQTALAMGSGDMEVLATPTMIALMENAAMMAVKPYLDAYSTTVGSFIQTSHLRPTPLAGKVEATATLTAIEGRKLTFAIEASDDKGVVGKGEHVRYIVDRAKFLSKMHDE